MAEYLAVSAQEVAANENVIFTNTAVQGNNLNIVRVLEL